MNFEDLKERLREAFQSLTSRVVESPAWHQLTEKYSDLPATGQKAALTGGILVGAMLLLLIPSCIFMGSVTNVQDFEDKKQLMRDLYRVNREVSALPPAPVAMSGGELLNRARGELSAAGLQGDQIGLVEEFDNKAKASPWIPRTLEQHGVAVTVKKINLQQIVDIGRKLEQMQKTAKLTGMDIRAQTLDPHYFDVVYRIVAFNLPPDTTVKAAPNKK